MANLQSTIDQAWENRAQLSPTSVSAEVREAVNETINQLDQGTLRVAEKINGAWTIHQWAKKAVLLSFRLQDNAVLKDGYSQYFDKVDSKFKIVPSLAKSWDASPDGLHFTFSNRVGDVVLLPLRPGGVEHQHAHVDAARLQVADLARQLAEGVTAARIDADRHARIARALEKRHHFGKQDGRQVVGGVIAAVFERFQRHTFAGPRETGDDDQAHGWVE